jgi:hypothetical protein
MTAMTRPVTARPRIVTRLPGRTALRLIVLELRHNAVPWILPFVIVLFWLTAYRKTMALPPLWNVRAASLQTSTVADFVAPVTGAAAWMGSREARRRMGDLLTITARPRWARQLAIWAATAIWAMAGCLGCLAVAYAMTARQASWGGPLWWPAAVTVTLMPACTALGFAAGALLPSRFTAPLIAIATFFGVALSTELINGSQSYWQISPVVTGPWDIGQDAGVATFYPYLPDLPIAQVMFLAGLTIALLGILALPPGAGGRALRAVAAGAGLAGLLAAGTAVLLAGTGALDAHGMISIPALHDAANDRPLRYPPVCGGTPIPVCLNPAYKTYLSITASALEPLLSQLAGLPGAPVRIAQAPTTYRQEPGNQVVIGRDGPALTGEAPVYRLILPIQQSGPPVTSGQLASEIQLTAGPAIVASITGAGPGASQAQDAVAAALLKAAGQRVVVAVGVLGQLSLPPGEALLIPRPQPGTPAAAAVSRFAALPAAVRHAWLAQHLTALRAGQITVAQLP